MNERRLGEILREQGAISGEVLEQALRAQREAHRHERLGVLLVRMRACDDEAIARAVAEQASLPYVDPVNEHIEAALIWRVPKELAEQHLVLPMQRALGADGQLVKGGPVRVAMADPRNMVAQGELQFILGAPLLLSVAAPSRILLAVNRHYDLEPVARRILDQVPEALRHPPPPRAARELSRGGPFRLTAGEDEGQAYVQLLDFILAQAIERGASDVHLSPTADGLRVRYRLDGMLRDVLQIPGWAIGPLTGRLKVVAGLSVYENRRPQDGGLAVSLGDRHVDLRVSTVPGQFGETAVVRLLDPRMLQIDLGSLGWDRQALAQWYRLVSQTQGLVLVVGPTGSGKSTTLYATINRLRSESTHIVTLEDPVEYRVTGISQTQVNAQIGMSFAAGIRSLLRQDPAVMVVGEIRDRESADAAVEAANTGHLVLSTVHTGHAIDAVTRLVDLGVAPFLVASALLGVVAQRLVRRLCPECSIESAPSAEDWARLGIAPQDLGGRVRRVGDGCPACEYVGYRGRIGVFEVMRLNEELREAIHERRPDRELWAVARKAGMRTLLEDALDKVAQGLTSLEEVARAVPTDRWERSASLLLRRSVELVEEQTEVLSADRLPEAVEAEVPPVDEVPGPVPGAPAEVLVVDDHEEILQLVSIALEDSFGVRLARDGEEALAEVGRKAPDAIVLDVMMPRLSGYEVCARLKAEPATARIPILMLSARGDAAHVKQGLQAGADDYLPKPFDPEELELRVRALLRRSGRLVPS